MKENNTKWVYSKIWFDPTRLETSKLESFDWNEKIMIIDGFDNGMKLSFYFCVFNYQNDKNIFEKKNYILCLKVNVF